MEPRLSEERRTLVAELLRSDGAVTVTDLRARFGVSPMTARRDLAVLADRGLARRTHGGAVLPSIAAGEHSFRQRLGAAPEAKARLAEAAFTRLGRPDGLPRCLVDDLLRRPPHRRARAAVRC